MENEKMTAAELDQHADIIRDAIEHAASEVDYCEKTNETTYPASWAGYETGSGTGLAGDCTTSDAGDVRRELVENNFWRYVNDNSYTAEYEDTDEYTETVEFYLDEQFSDDDEQDDTQI